MHFTGDGSSGDLYGSWEDIAIHEYKYANEVKSVVMRLLNTEREGQKLVVTLVGTGGGIIMKLNLDISLETYKSLKTALD